MKPCVTAPLPIGGLAFGGPKPLFCVPLVAAELKDLLVQARGVLSLGPDLMEWRADSFGDLEPGALVDAVVALRSISGGVPIIFTLRSAAEGGARAMEPSVRAGCIDVVLRSGLVDLVDLELGNGRVFLEPLMRTAHEHGAKVILSFHDFQATPANEVLLTTIAAMVELGADVAKLACMPRDRGDVLRFLAVTWEARQKFPPVPLCTMSMGGLGALSRLAGFLYGSDMAFAVGQRVSAPGQMPLAEARALVAGLLNFSE